MKKRIFLIVSSIICCLVTLSLVIYTIVKATQTGANGSGLGGDNPTTDVSKPGYEDTINTQNIEYNLIVGDTFSDDVLAGASNILPSFLSVTQDNKILAEEAGSDIFVVELNGVRYNYDVQVWTKGSGTSDDPYNIVRVEDLIGYVEDDSISGAYFVQRVDIDLAGQNWIPLGNEGNIFNGKYDGNGFSIKNMSIVVNEDNFSDFVCDKYGYTSMHLGFFGYVYMAEIKNLTIENASIDTTAIDNVDVRESVSVDKMYVGGLAGYAYNSQITADGNTATVSIKSSAGDQNGVDGAVGGLIGMVTGASMVDGYSVNATINASDISYVKSGVNYGANVAGLVGRVCNSQLKDCTVNADIVIGNYQNSKAAGAVVIVDGASVVQNLTVESVKIELNKVVKNASQCVRMAGAIDYISNGAHILASTVKNAKITGITCGQVSGFASMNDGEIVDCSASGTLKGTYVAGLVDTNEGTIKYSEDAGVEAVNVTIEAQLWGAGLVNDNYGTIQGSSDKTEVNAKIYWYKVAEKYFDKTNSMLAGIATINSGIIRNLEVIANIYDAVNAGGAVGTSLGTATLENLEVYTTVRTIKQNGSSAIQTYTVGGVVADVKDGSSLIMTDVVAKMSVNAKAISSYKYTLDVFGAVIGQCGGTVDLKNIEVGVSVFANDTIGVDEDTKNCAKVKAILGTSSNAAIQGSKAVDVEVYGNVNVNGTVKSIKSYPLY